MQSVSIIIQGISRDAISFINKIIDGGLDVKYILVAPKVELHPNVVLQRKIREKVYPRKKKLFLLILIDSIRLKLFLFGIFLRTISLFKKFKLIYLNQKWDNCSDCFGYITIIHSLEGIIPENVLRKFENGLINIHPAILPNYRGLDGGLWALYESGKLGVTAYIIDKGIDTGEIIKKYELSYDDFNGITEYISKLKELKVSSYPDAISLYLSNKFLVTKPVINKKQNRGVMSKELLGTLIRKYGL